VRKAQNALGSSQREELAPPAMRYLLDAEPVDDDEPPPSAKI
jgi:hypothetical protein